MPCQTCKKWKGNKHSQWADCYSIIFSIFPMVNYEDRYGDTPELTFDPHDVRYYLSSSPIHRDLLRSAGFTFKDGLRCSCKKEQVMWMDDQQIEMVKTKKITYYQTRKDFTCPNYVELG